MELDESAGPLAEYTALRGELDSRFKAQIQLFTLQLAATGAVFSLAISRHDLLGILLILPFSTYLLCARYSAQETRQVLIGRFMHEELSSRIPGGLHWEAWWRGQRTDRSYAWTIPLLLAYPGSAFSSLVWVATLTFGGTSSSSIVRAALVVVWILGIAAATACVYLIISTARIVGRRPSATLGSSLERQEHMGEDHEH